ncbi:unnamed protein product [Caenorhabditis sp. 36 PRJEB53466]|nr:unnamed protein product [Caenorhabditis sp. 36 PRJEB53466]
MSAPLSAHSRAKNQEDPEEWENHLILRVPSDVAARMTHAVHRTPHSEELGICINEDNRNVQIRLGNQILPAKILDLPTISEIHKTTDNTTLYKVADVSQIIMCDGAMSPKKDKKLKEQVKMEGEEEPEAGPSVMKPKTARQIARERLKEYHYPHGITAPMKNAKKRRFRKKKEKKIMAVEEIERELKKLLRSDLEAQSVRWEIVEDDGTGIPETLEEDSENYDPEDGSDLDKDDDDNLELTDDDDL